MAEWSKKLQEKAEENRKKTAEFQKKQREERKKLLEAGNQGGFNMNDMEEQLRQLEGEYSDSEDDCGEEEEEFDELMEEVLKENMEDQSVLSGEDSLSEEIEEDIFNKAPSKKKKKKKKKIIQNVESDTDANKLNAEGEANVNSETDQPNIDNPESLELDVSEAKKSSKRQKKKNRKVEIVKSDSDNEEHKFQLNNDSSGDEAFKSGKKSKGKKKQKNAKDIIKAAPKGKAESVDPPVEQDQACLCPETETVEDEEEDLGKSKKKAKNKKDKSKSAVSENDEEIAKGDLTCAQCR